MEPSYNELLSEILTVADYAQKEEFIREFELMNQLEAIENSFKKFPPQLQESLLNDGTPEKVMKHIHPDAYHEELLRVAAKALAEFLRHVQPALTIEQKEKMLIILQKFSQN